MSRLKYDEAFRLAAVELVTKRGDSIRDAALSLGINNQTLHNWIQLHRKSQEPHDVQSEKDLVKENRELKRQVARLTMEREILKKATAFFARESS